MAMDEAGELRWEPGQAVAAARAATPPVAGATCLPMLIEQADRFCSNAWELSQGLELPPFNIVHAMRLTGNFDIGAAHCALRNLVAMHEALRVGIPAGGLLIRGVILTMGEREWILLIAAEHLTIDGRSFSVLLDDFSELYAAKLDGTVPSPDAPESTYSELVRDEVERCTSAERKEALDFWSDRLSEMGAVPAIRLPIPLPPTNAPPAAAAPLV